MTSTNDDDIIVVDTSVFHSRWKEMCSVPIPPAYLERVEELKTRYACFRTRPAHPPRNNPKGQKAQENPYELPTIRQMRPRIGALFTNTEGKARKNFTSFMNKLSPQNREEILPNFIRSLVPENIHIYMDQIVRLFQVQPTYHDLYMEVLYEIVRLAPERAKELMEEDFQGFLEEGRYQIPTMILENLDDLDTSSEQMDQLCEYVQWKKRTKALITLYIHCMARQMYGSDKDIERTLECLGGMVDTHWSEGAIVDIYLDLALHAVESMRTYYPKGAPHFSAVLGHYCDWGTRKDTLKPSSRFKVLDIIEIIRRKAHPVGKI